MIKTEEAVICALLVEKNVMVNVASLLRPEMFSTPQLGFIYAAMMAQYERGEHPDIVSTSEQMKRMDSGRCAEMGGLNFIRQGLTRIRHAGNLAVYAEAVKDQYIHRLLTALFVTLTSKAQQPESNCANLISEAENELLLIREQQQDAQRSMQSAGQLAAEVIAYHRQRTEKEEDNRCVLTGLDGLDDLIGGLHPGELYVLAGRPGDGKSAIAMQIAYNVAEKGKKVCLFSLEMDPRQIMARYFTGHAGVATSRLRKETPTERDFLQMEKLRERFDSLLLHIDYTPGNTVENIRGQVTLHQKRFGCDLIIVDYLHLLDLKHAKNETLEQAIARQVRTIRQIARETGCPLLLLSQMNRNVENRKDGFHMPQLSDLRDSGTIEQVADCVFFVYRPERFLKGEQAAKSPGKGSGRLLVAKNRNGSIGMTSFHHNETFTRIFASAPKTPKDNADAPNLFN